MGLLESVLSLSDTAKRVKELKEEYEGKDVILGVDDMDLFKGIGLKFLALGKLLEDNDKLRGQVVLVQILNQARSSGKDIQDLKFEIEAIAKEVNDEYGDEQSGYRSIVCINGPVSTQEKVAYYAISECCIVNQHCLYKHGTLHIVHSFNKTKTDEDEAWLVLKAEIFSCSKNLELIKVGFEKILEKDMDCNKVNQDRILEYLELVDDCNSYLKDIKVAMDKCERENTDIRFFCNIVDRIKVLEGDMVGALKYFKQNKSE